MRGTLVVAVSAVLMVACATPGATTPAAQPVAAAQPVTPPARCPRSVEGADAVLKPGALVVFGEVHGTREMPELIGDLACQAATTAPQVWVGMELSKSEQPRVDVYLRSAGTEQDRNALLAGGPWQGPMQDGRTSAAMLGLIDRVRQLQAEGRPVHLFLFDLTDEELRAQPRPDRDAGMAKNVLAARAKAPQATFVVLVGNLHALLTKGMPWDPNLVPMGAHLKAAEPAVTSFDMASSGGKAWVCMSKSPKESPVCAEWPIRGTDAAPKVWVERDYAEGDPYYGALHVGEPHASPPARGVGVSGPPNAPQPPANAPPAPGAPPPAGSPPRPPLG